MSCHICHTKWKRPRLHAVHNVFWRNLDGRFSTAIFKGSNPWVLLANLITSDVANQTTSHSLPVVHVQGLVCISCQDIHASVCLRCRLFGFTIIEIYMKWKFIHEESLCSKSNCLLCSEKVLRIVVFYRISHLRGRSKWNTSRKQFNLLPAGFTKNHPISSKLPLHFIWRAPWYWFRFLTRSLLLLQATNSKNSRKRSRRLLDSLSRITFMQRSSRWYDVMLILMSAGNLSSPRFLQCFTSSTRGRNSRCFTAKFMICSSTRDESAPE